ncbi:MAG TPA: hypothetical protein VM049_07805 [Gaiellaceae bacterium]|nr:hypothetical protein [Gaiellaceae bacterium]
MSSRLGALAGRALFTVADRTYAWDDVLLGAELRGELGSLERQTRQGLASVKRLEAEEAEAPSEAIRAAATVFRYDRNLLAAEELESWLDDRGLTVSDWNAYLRRQVLRERWEDELERIEADFAVGNDEVEAALPAEAICTGFLRQAAERLAEDAALAEADGAGGDAVDHPTIAALSLTADAVRARVPGAAEIKREVTAHALDWLRIEADTLELADAEAAREAALCVRVDGRPLIDVADDCGVAAEAATLYLGDADPELQAALASAAPGELVGPVARGTGHLLLQVRAKAEPSADDPEVARRAAAVLAARRIERELRDRVVWHERP